MKKTEFNTGVIRPVECYKEGWELIKEQYWILFAVSILGMVIGGISLYVLLGAMVCGIFLCYFRVIDGEKAEVETLFKGFGYFWPSLLVMIVIVVPMIIVFSLIYLPLFVASFMGSRMSPDELFTMLVGSLAIEFIVAVVMVCLHTLLMFSFPLIVDRGLSGPMSMIVSARAVWKNLAGVTGLWALSFVATLAGYLALCVGAYFVIPIVIAGNVVAYRKVFPKAGGDLTVPPPPETYGNAGSGIEE